MLPDHREEGCRVDSEECVVESSPAQRESLAELDTAACLGRQNARAVDHDEGGAVVDVPLGRPCVREGEGRAATATDGGGLLSDDAGGRGAGDLGRHGGGPDTEVPGREGDWDARRLAWVYLSRVVEGPCAALSALIDSVGVVEAARAVRECALPDVLRGATELRRGIDRAERDLAVMERIGGRVVTPDDAEWPAWRLLGLGQLDPEQDAGAAMPLVLWVRGPRSLVECTERAVAVVGARCSTGYGNQVTGEIAGELAARGWTIVSGAAFGIDGMAHRAALAVGGVTVAVLACGPDRPYPVQHDRLLAEIADTGVVVTEYPPGCTARKHYFLARNRLIAALADGVVVVEAGMRSGARNTVKWARRLGRPALAVPGPVTSAASVGCHRMIREGEAFLTTSAEEVIDEAGPLRLSLPGTVPPNPEDDMSGDEALAYAALPQTGSRLPRLLAEQSGLTIPAVRAALCALELGGLVACDENGWYRTVPQAARRA
ncbi:DNA-protecting protein DprA [Nocardia uniformis]|uniref:DNA-protecting protein DprA n=1 Tax=Nocardia uniformis TaxID=53432 RepID=A0A849C1V2_9NOCA|nr:DNA-protecting protein DprA [Nocardia uniformis]